jgi:N-hydroxyarylamine O-acetyltransferase
VVPVNAYLARIGYFGASSPTSANLRAIHRAHLFAVPFENLDIALGRKIVVDEDVTVRKIVELRRGGFCYELNGAFAALLQALGFQITLLSARVSGQEAAKVRSLIISPCASISPSLIWLMSDLEIHSWSRCGLI